MKELGGYIEFEHFHGKMLHEDGIKLNCGRNCLAYLIEARNIRKIALPFFLCDSVKDVCKRYDLDVVFYHIDEQMHPLYEKDCSDRYVYLVNYYGQLDLNCLNNYKKKYNSLILDNAQAYFSKPVNGIDTLYTCRKFFGVSDGGILFTDSVLDKELQIDVSSERMHFLLGRFEGNASDHYNEYVENNELFETEPIKEMSLLTENLLRSIDYSFIKNRRTENYTYLMGKLSDTNLLTLEGIDGAFAYPLLIKNGDLIRDKLIKKKIYIPKLWPNVNIKEGCSSLEQQLADDILPIPCDQRYTLDEMDYIVNTIKELA